MANRHAFLLTPWEEILRGERIHAPALPEKVLSGTDRWCFFWLIRLGLFAGAESRESVIRFPLASSFVDFARSKMWAHQGRAKGDDFLDRSLIDRLIDGWLPSPWDESTAFFFSRCPSHYSSIRVIANKKNTDSTRTTPVPLFPTTALSIRTTSTRPWWHTKQW